MEYDSAAMNPDALSRIRRVAGRQTTILTHYGRKSGKPFQVTIWFVVDGDRVYIGTANADRNWVKNVQATARIKMSVGGEALDATARFLAGDEHARAMRAIRRKYWMFAPFIGLFGLLVKLGIARDRSGSFEVTLQ
jgi:deazaflavin-dependent oxidoreductase (nitroreductase family)